MQNFELLLKYVAAAYEFKFEELVARVGLNIPPEFRGCFMTAADRLKLEGIEKGIQMGVENIARKLFTMNKTLEEIIEITGLTREQLIAAGVLFG